MKSNCFSFHSLNKRYLRLSPERGSKEQAGGKFWARDQPGTWSGTIVFMVGSVHVEGGLCHLYKCEVTAFNSEGHLVFSRQQIQQKSELLTILGDNEIQWSSEVSTTQNLPDLISSSHIVALPLPPSTALLMGGSLVTSILLLSLTNWCQMNDGTDAGAVELFCVSDVLWSQTGVSLDDGGRRLLTEGGRLVQPPVCLHER